MGGTLAGIEWEMKSRALVSRWAVACSLVLSATTMFAADPQPIHWNIKATTAALPLKKAQKVRARISATIAPGWHLYAFEQEPGGPLPTSISLAAGQSFVADGPASESTPKMDYDSNFNLSTSVFEGHAAFTLPVRVSRVIPAGSLRLMVDVAFQTCNDHMCLPLTVKHLSAPIQRGETP
jgi:thiol:disulfide interchange protein DsbD